MISNYEVQYKDLLQNVLLNGKQHQARNGRTVRLFNQQLSADLQQGFPMLTGRRLPWDGIKGELLAFLRGNILLDDFHALGCNFWDKQALTSPRGDKHIGPTYGYQWRHFTAYRQFEHKNRGLVTDQLAELITSLSTDPGSRRHVLTAWQPNDLDSMALPPCHMMAQWHVESSTAGFSRKVESSTAGFSRKVEQPITGDKPILHCTVTMRSADMFVGVPADMASYALFTHLLAMLLDFEPGTVCLNMADCHIYEANEEQVETYLQSPCYALPALSINITGKFQFDTIFVNVAIAKLEVLRPQDIRLVNYQNSGLQPVTMVA